jgi:hypothetical protein
MAIKVEADDSASGTGYWTSSVFDARSILGNIADEFENDLAENYPEYVRDANVYKVTITVEKV